MTILEIIGAAAIAITIAVCTYRFIRAIRRLRNLPRFPQPLNGIRGIHQ